MSFHLFAQKLPQTRVSYEFMTEKWKILITIC